MSEMIAFAKRELALLRGPSGEPDEMQDAIEAHVLTMVEAFANEDHSGSSAAYAIGILEKVLRFEPVTPLTGADEEWTILENDDECYAQNKRSPRVFKRRDGTAYDIDAVVFRTPDGACFTSSASRRAVKFPYTPKTVIEDRED